MHAEDYETFWRCSTVNLTVVLFLGYSSYLHERQKKEKKRDHIQLFPTSAVEAKGVYKQRTRAAWGHAALRGWARLLLDRRRDLIVHGPRATRNAGGKFDDEEHQRHDGG